MTKRREFLKRSVIGTAGIAIGGIGITSNASAEDLNVQQQAQKDWHTDPEWRKIRYGDWGGPGVSAGPGPMDTILVKDYAPKSSVVTRETFIPKAKYPVIDCHVHVLSRTKEEVAEWVKTMDEVGMETSIVLTGATGKAFDNYVDLFPKAYPGRFLLYCGMDRTDADKPDYPARSVAELVRCHDKGARGVGEIIDKGTGIARASSPTGNLRFHPDAPCFDAFWEKCGELKMPVSLHMADHPSCWAPLDVYQERSPDYQQFNQFGKDGLSYDELIVVRNKTLAKHPKTVFVLCHMSNMGNDLEKLSLDMDKYPNLYIDTSARDYEIGRTPRASARFLAKYQNRIVFGTDQDRVKSMYQIHWRLFETADEYFPGRVGWRYYGLELPAPVLEAIYRGTARKIFSI